MENLARAAQAMSDETRIRILRVLLQRECCVCEIMQALGISQTRASRNLKILYDAGFLNMSPDGLYTVYSVCSNKNKGFYSGLYDAVKNAPDVNQTAQKDFFRLDQSKRIGPGCSS
jgi:ArsR family transcriptional regulator